MILKKITQNFTDEIVTTSFVKTDNAIKILDEQPEFQQELSELFQTDKTLGSYLKIGNAKSLILAINSIDTQCVKIDLPVKMSDLQLERMLEAEKAVFEIMGVTDKFVLKENKSDILRAETRYTAKHDILDYYHFSKFANYCRDNEFEDLVDHVKEYLRIKNLQNDEIKNLRIVFRNQDQQFFIRAFTSGNVYKNFGINFSVLVALLTLEKYSQTSKKDIYINYFNVDESTIYVSFAFAKTVKINKNLSLSFNLILENNEVKDGSVSFNGVFKLKFDDKGRSSEIYLKPSLKKKDSDYITTDLLTYAHRGKVENVISKISELPMLIDYFIEQVTEDAKLIISMTHANDVKNYIADKIKKSKKEEFKEYRKSIFNKLMNINVSNTFELFELLRKVEELFEHEDIVAKDFWRQKLYETLTSKK